MKRILVLHGVNFNMFGKRDPAIYGTITLEEIDQNLLELGEELGCLVETFDYSKPFPIQAGLDYARINYPTLAAVSPELITKARNAIKPK